MVVAMAIIASLFFLLLDQVLKFFLEIMRNPIKFIQEVKQEAFKVSWPTWKETLQGALMVFVMAVVMSLFFLLLDQVLKFFLELLLKVSI